MNSKLPILVAAIAIAAVAGASTIMLMQDHEIGSQTYSVGDMQVTVTGDLMEGEGIVCEVKENRISFTSAEKGEWTVFDRDKPSSTDKAMYKKYKGDRYSGDSVSLDHPGYGSFDVKVDTGNGTLEGSVTVDGTVKRHYEWQCRGEEFSIDVSFKYCDYLAYQSKDVNRYASNRDRSVFVDNCNGLTDTISERISFLTEGLSEYMRANVILAFVQECFEYPPNTMSGSVALMSGDMYLTGHSDYTMYPIETLFYNAGDCEDTSILAASLFRSAGLQSALLMVPGHAMVCVAIDEMEETIPYGSFELYHSNVRGHEYYVCETTTNVAVDIGLGSSQDFGDEGIPYHMHPSEDRIHGMFIL